MNYNKTKMLLRILCAVFLTAISIYSQTAPPELAQWRAANYSDVRYKLKITLETQAPLMKGAIEISVALTAEGAKNDLILDWRAAQFANDKDNPYADVWAVNQVKFDLVGSGYKRIDDHLIISKRYLKTGENVIKINFTSPVKTSGAGVARYVDKEDNAEYVYSQFAASGASAAFPVFDQPDLKARFNLTVNIGGGRQHPNWIVVSNTEQETFFNSTWNILYTFKETNPISPNVFAFAAGEFAEFEDFDESTTLVKTAPVGSTKIYEPYINPNRSKAYVRKSQTENFKAREKEFFRLNGVSNLSQAPKIDFVLLPGIADAPDYDGIRFLRESPARK